MSLKNTGAAAGRGLPGDGGVKRPFLKGMGRISVRSRSYPRLMLFVPTKGSFILNPSRALISATSAKQNKNGGHWGHSHRSVLLALQDFIFKE